MAEILERANANSGSFYHFFHNKEDLLSTVLQEYERMLYPMLLEPIWTTPDPIERIFRLLAKYREALVMTGFEYGCPIGRIALEVPRTMKESHRRIAANFDAWKAAIETCLTEAQRLQRLSKSIDAKAAASLVLSVMEGSVMQARSYGDTRAFDQAIDQLGAFLNRRAHPLRRRT